MSDFSLSSAIPLISGQQLKAGRVLAGLSRADLAARSSISVETIARLENDERDSRIHTLRQVVGTLEASGIRFLRDGVLLQKERGT
jgi:transcriptional regulator with XRE-family HTH domain